MSYAKLKDLVSQKGGRKVILNKNKARGWWQGAIVVSGVQVLVQAATSAEVISNLLLVVESLPDKTQEQRLEAVLDHLAEILGVTYGE